MYKTMEHSDCNADDCKWKRYHADLTSMGKDSKFMDCVIDHISIGTARQTRLQSDQNQLSVADGIKLVKERLSTLA